jgi:phage shock protein A
MADTLAVYPVHHMRPALSARRRVGETADQVGKEASGVGFFDVILGRSKPAKPDLDRLFALSTAAVTLEAATGFTPTGLGSVCFRAAEGGAFAQLEKDIRELLDNDRGPNVEVSTDSYGYTWLLARHDPQELEGLVTDLHAVNATLEGNGFGPSGPRKPASELRTRKETIKATYTAAEAQTKINEAFSGISEEMGDVGLAIQRAEEKTETMKARAGAIDELLASGALEDYSGPSDDLQAELDRMGSSGAGVDLELERLKNELGQGEAPKQLDAGASGASGAASRPQQEQQAGSSQQAQNPPPPGGAH